MGTRMFETHRVRKEIYLDRLWTVHTIDNNCEKDSEFKMVVPSTWESNPILSSYKGKAIYSNEIECGGNIKINFKGVSHTADIYFDGKHVGYHYNAYTEFSIVLKELEYKKHLIEVKVSNELDEESALHVSNDYYSYGGITRPVVVESIEDVYIDNVQFVPTKIGNEWYGEIKAYINSLTNTEKDLILEIKINNKVYKLDKKELMQDGKIVLFDKVKFEGIEEYTLENPKLYKIEANLICNERIIDDFIDRIGFREIKVSGKDILLNNKKIVIKGVNRHEDYAEFGCSIPLEAMYRDIEMIKQLGANCIRTCHYPNDERFLDLCDENGILVWEESHARGLDEEQMRHKNFEKQSFDCIKEMIYYHINHPSIFVWGILNECVSNTEFGKSCYEKQFKLIKELDKSRPVTYAALEAYLETDMSLELVDIVSYNLYPRWYVDVSVKESMENFKQQVEKNGGKGKPMLISEIGAGAIYGYHSNNKEKWTEEYQEMAVSEQVSTILEDKDLSGVIIWQYADCRVEPTWFEKRPKSQNNKGLVDIYRREKMAYHKVKEIFNRY